MTRVAMNLLWARPGRVGGSEDYFARQLLGLREFDHEFDVYAKLPLMLRMFEGRIEKMIKEQIAQANLGA